jgi:hypothetical protein
MKNDFDPFENEKNIRERGRERQKRSWACAALTKRRLKNASLSGCREKGWSNFAKAAMAGKRVSMLRCSSGSRSILDRNHHQDW